MADSQLSIEPLGPGDLIDRALRFYRRFFWTFVLIAAPPVLVGTLFSVGWTSLARQIFTLTTDPYSVEYSFYYLFTGLGAFTIWMIEMIATLAVMGGASRNFVRHLLFGEAITFRETYKNTWQRLGGLLAASTFLTITLGIIGTVIFYFGLFLAVMAIMLVVALFVSIPLIAVIFSVVIGIAALLGTVWLFSLIASRFAYVPQVMLVEGQGVFSALGRSASLAGGSAWRLAALFLFTTVATYSALALLYVPLLWYASEEGVEMFSFGAAFVPAWYEIAQNLIGQISFILLSPVWTVGLCLLYVDERVRSEGYDLELMAAARLGEIPAVPADYVNPLTPALAYASTSATPDKKSFTSLGLR